MHNGNTDALKVITVSPTAAPLAEIL